MESYQVILVDRMESYQVFLLVAHLDELAAVRPEVNAVVRPCPEHSVRGGVIDEVES